MVNHPPTPDAVWAASKEAKVAHDLRVDSVRWRGMTRTLPTSQTGPAPWTTTCVVVRCSRVGMGRTRAVWSKGDSGDTVVVRKWIGLSVLAVTAITAATLISSGEPDDSADLASLRPRETRSALALTGPPLAASTPAPPANAWQCDVTIPSDQSTVDGSSTDIAPGTVLCLTRGTRPPLNLTSLRGTEDEPIVIVNSGSVQIRGSETDYAGIDVTNSQHVRITGTGADGGPCGARQSAADQRCGISVHGSARGIAATEGTTDLTIDHVEISGTTHSGIFARTEIEEGLGREDFIQEHTVVAFVYLHDIGREGIYLGSSSFQEGEDPLLTGVIVEENLLVDTGWDGIQVGSAVADCRIERNVVVLAGSDDRQDQDSGIIANRGSSCDIARNVVVSAAGAGIYVQGNGGHSVNDNLVVGAGARGASEGDGIVVRSGSNPGNAIRVVHNTVVAPARHGLRLLDESTSDHVLANNLVVAAYADPYEWSEGVTRFGNMAFEGLDILVGPSVGDFRPASPAVLLDAQNAVFRWPDLLGSEPPTGRRTAGAIEWQGPA